MQKLLIVKAQNTGNGNEFYGQTEDGSVFERASAYLDANEERCLMRVWPSADFDGLSIQECEQMWESGCTGVSLVEVEVWGLDEIEALFPADATRWFVETHNPTP